MSAGGLRARLAERGGLDDNAGRNLRREATALIDRICAGFNSAAPDLCDRLWSPDCVGHGPRGDFGLEVIRRSHAASRKVFSGLKTEAQVLFAAGDMFAVRYSVAGTNDGMSHGLPPTGAAVWACGLSVLRVAKGRIVEEWFVFDELGQLRRLGAVTEAGQGCPPAAPGAIMEPEVPPHGS